MVKVGRTNPTNPTLQIPVIIFPRMTFLDSSSIYMEHSSNQYNDSLDIPPTTTMDKFSHTSLIFCILLFLLHTQTLRLFITMFMCTFIRHRSIRHSFTYSLFSLSRLVHLTMRVGLSAFIIWEQNYLTIKTHVLLLTADNF